jgi:regulator of protease activity HflC (stomatin/prohibitin superfamily)
MPGIIIFLILTLVALGFAKFYKLEVGTKTRDRYGNLQPDGGTTQNKTPNRIGYGAAGLFGALTLLFLALTSLYTQGVGEASVIKSFSGEIVGFNDKAGMGTKAPWDDRITYDILNQQAVFSLASNVHDDQKDFVKGGEITVIDKDGVSSNVDAAIRYSIRGDQVIPIFTHFGNQQSFEAKLITQDIRDVVRTAPNSLSTLDMLTKRSDLEKQIFNELKTRWEKEGVQVESVALQDVRPPDSIKQKYTDAQNANTQKTVAQAELESTKISAQQKVVQAQADADSNRILDASLTPNILQIRGQDAIKDAASHGNTIFTDGSQLLNLQAPAKK